MNRRHSIALVAASSCAATLLVGGIARATIPGDGGVINGCYGKLGGVVRVIDVAKGEKCHAAFETPLSWNQKGDPGLPGAAGAPGTNGSNGNDGVSPTVAQLAPGDSNCPAGGAAITDTHGSTAFVCSGQPFSGTFTSPSGEYSISVTDAGISLSRGGTPVVQIAGSSINITGHEVGITSELDTTIQAGHNALITSGLNTAIATGNDATISSVGNTAITIGREASVSIGRNLAVQTGSAIAVQSGSSTSVLSGTELAIQSGSTTSMQSGGTLVLNGSQVRVNGGVTCQRAARVGDAVSPTQITAGSSTVCIG